MYSTKNWHYYFPYTCPITTTDGHVTIPNSAIVNKISNSPGVNSSHQSPSISRVTADSNCNFVDVDAASDDQVKYSLEPMSTVKSVSILSSTTMTQTNPSSKVTHSDSSFHPLVHTSNAFAKAEYLNHLHKSTYSTHMSNSMDLQQTLSMVNIHSNRKVNSSRDGLFMNSFDLQSNLPASFPGSDIIQKESNSKEESTVGKAITSQCYWLQNNSYPQVVHDLFGDRLNQLPSETTKLIHNYCHSNKDSYSCKSKPITNRPRCQSKLPQKSEIVSHECQFNVKKKPRCQRTSFTYEQLETLERYFNESSQYPDSNIKFTLAQLTNLSQARISVWFKNRRAKHRKSVKFSSSSSSSSSYIFSK